MGQRMKIISAGLITGAVFVLFLYSPVGSPELYRTAAYATVMVSPGVNFAGGTTGSSRSKGSGSYSPIVVPTSANSSAKQNISAQASSVASSSFGQSGGNAGNVYQTSRETSSPSGGAMLFAGGSSSSASGRSSGNNSGASSYGFIALATDVSSDGSTSSGASAADPTLINGATDPGGDPIGDAIPVSDGWIFMLMMVMGYAGFKDLKRKKLQVKRK